MSDEPTPCTGAHDCPAETHILGCFRSKPETPMSDEPEWPDYWTEDKLLARDGETDELQDAIATFDGLVAVYRDDEHHERGTDE